MSFEVCFTDPWLDETAELNPQVPQFLEVTIAGRAYAMDTSFEPYRRDAFRHRSIQSQRESISLDNVPGEGTVNTEGLWRRSAIDWKYGAGQPYQDRKDSIDARFSESKGINPWMEWQLELLNDTQLVWQMEDGQVLQVGSYIYILESVGQEVIFTSDLTTFATVSGILGGSITGMATDGWNVWFSTSETGQAGGIYTAQPGSTVATQYVSDQQFDGIWYVGDRLMATWGPTVYNIISSNGPLDLGPITTQLTSGAAITSLAFSGGIAHAVPNGATVNVSTFFPQHSQAFIANGGASSGATSVAVVSQNANFTYPVGTDAQLVQAPPTALWTNPNSAFHFSAMAAGSSQIYMSGYVADGNTGSVVYRSTIEATGTALTIPVQALPMEGGEYCTSLYGYLNYIFVGSNLGVRMCRTIAAFDPTGNEGDLEAGPLFPGLYPPGPVTQPVQCLVGNNRFVYFGWSDYDSASTGIGRCDLSTFIDTQAPAFASDLMVTSQAGVHGNIVSMDWCNINDAPIFVVQGHGVYTIADTFVDSGYVQSGFIGYGIPDDKTVLAASVGTIQPQLGNVAVSLASDSSQQTLTFIGNQSSGSPNSTILPVNAMRGDLFTIRLTLTPDPENLFVGPTVHRWLLKAIPAITSGTTVSVVIRLWDVEDVYGQDTPFNPYVEKAFLENLRTTQTVFAYTEGPLTYPYCTIDEIDWLPHKFRDSIAEGGFEGNIIVYIKTYDLGA